MQKLFEKVQKNIEDFLEQRDKGILILTLPGEQIAYVVKILESIENAGSPDVFLLFPHDFESPDKFTFLVVERVKMSYEAAREELGLSGEMKNVPSFPMICLDEQQPAALRLREALCFARSLIPPGKGQRLVCALLPLIINDPSGYGQLMQQIIPTNGLIPWFRGMRIVLREDSNSPMLSSKICKAPFVEVKHLDLSTDAMIASLREEAKDPGVSSEQRAQSLLQLACIDYAHCRYEDAITKYTELLAYYQETQNSTMQAFVLNGIGDTYNRVGKFDMAQDWYERALVPAAESKSPIILFSLSRNLGHVYYQLKQYSQAEVFFDGAQQLGLQTHDPEAKILSMEWRGLSQEKQKAFDRAADSFEEATRLSHEFKRNEHLNRNLEHLSNTLKHIDQHDRLARVKREVALLSKGESGE
ncbi:tetratricopeptide repeat protein [bacterium]|nr:tetratricopeptide repeat protein [bacterium]